MTIQDVIDSIMSSEEKKKELVDLFQKHTTDFKWISDNIKELRLKYSNSYIAVQDQKVILSSKNRVEIVNSLMKKHGDIKGITIKYVTDKPLRLLV